MTHPEKEGFFGPANNLLSDLPERTRKIVKKRFGIDQEKAETLDCIGRENGITRERVRQIIADALKKISEKRNNPDFLLAEERIIWTINQNNGIMEEKKLITKLSGGNIREANTIVFFGTISSKIQIIDEKGLLKKSWMIAGESTVERIKELAVLAGETLKREHKLLTDNEIAGKIIAKKPHFSSAQILSHLAVIPEIKKNKFGKWGMANWKEVSPRGTRERVYLVLKEYGKPLHFSEVAQLIDKHELGKRKAHPQTVHNELIKDTRFVLVGRGIYALKEWGYEKGTIRDVLEDILRGSSEPMGREAILKEVMKKRKVKKATVMINLNNARIFEKVGGRYAVKK